MQAVRIHTFGGPEVMQVEDVPTPSPQAGQVLVRLAAAGLNYIDVYQCYCSGAAHTAYGTQYRPA